MTSISGFFTFLADLAYCAACSSVRARYKSNVYESRLEASWEPPCHLQRPSLHVCRQQTQMQKKVSRSTIAATRLHPQFGLKLPLLLLLLLLLKSGLLHRAGLTHTVMRHPQ